MLRTLYVAVVALVATLWYGTLVMIVALVRSTSPLIDRFIRSWARVLVRAAGIRLSTENADRADPGQGYIVIANHSSYFDIPVLLATMPQSVRFMAKASLFGIPIFGWAIRAAGFIPVDRKNRKKAVESFDLAAQRIRKGNTIVIFPEEGRSRTRGMRAFQRGAFLLSLRSHLPILPVGIVGNYDVMNVHDIRIRGGEVKLRFGNPINTDGMSVKAKDELATRTRTEVARLVYGDPAMADAYGQESDPSDQKSE